MSQTDINILGSEVGSSIGALYGQHDIGGSALATCIVDGPSIAAHGEGIRGDGRDLQAVLVLVISVLFSTKKCQGYAVLDDLWDQISSSQDGDLGDAREETESTHCFVISVVSAKGAPTANWERKCQGLLQGFFLFFFFLINYIRVGNLTHVGSQKIFQLLSRHVLKANY